MLDHRFRLFRSTYLSYRLELDMLHVNKWRCDLFISWLILNCNEWLLHYITFLMILMGISALVCYYNLVLDRFWTTELHKLITTGSDRTTFPWFVQTLTSTKSMSMITWNITKIEVTNYQFWYLEVLLKVIQQIVQFDIIFSTIWAAVNVAYQ